MITDISAIRSAFERNAKIVATRPQVAQKTYATRIQIRDGLTCDVHADTDLRGMYGVDGIPAGYSEIRYQVAVQSSAPEEDVIRVLDLAEAHRPSEGFIVRPVI